jgi:hypothetical protein
MEVVLSKTLYARKRKLQSLNLQASFVSSATLASLSCSKLESDAVPPPPEGPSSVLLCLCVKRYVACYLC